MSEHTPSRPPLDALEAELIALGRTLVVDPPAADLAERVLARIAQTAHEYLAPYRSHAHCHMRYMPRH